MRSIALFPALAPVLIVGLIVGLIAVSCAGPVQTLPPPPPPPPPPGSGSTSGSGPFAEVTPRPAAERPAPSGASFAVAVFRSAGAGREPSADQTRRTVDLLRKSGRQAGVAPAPPDLPASILEAARAAAAAHRLAGGKEDVFIFGEVASGTPAQVRLAAVDLREEKTIDVCGYQGPEREIDGILGRAVQDLLGRVEVYRSAAARR